MNAFVLALDLTVVPAEEASESDDQAALSTTPATCVFPPLRIVNLDKMFVRSTC